MLAQRIAVAFCLNAACSAFAGPHLVRFEGAITEIADGAPESFWVGERVAGAFVYDPDLSPLLVTHATSNRTALTCLTPFNNLCPDGLTSSMEIGVQQVWRGRNLAVGTEGGSSYRDESLDLHWLGFGKLSEGTFELNPRLRTNFAAANSGFFANSTLRLFDEPLLPLTLTTLAGPAASELQITLEAEEPSFRYDDRGMPVASLRSFAGPTDLVPKTGYLSFGDATTSVTFEIDRITVVAVPEPLTFGGAVILIVGWQRRRC